MELHFRDEDIDLYKGELIKIIQEIDNNYRDYIFQFKMESYNLTVIITIRAAKTATITTIITAVNWLSVLPGIVQDTLHLIRSS